MSKKKPIEAKDLHIGCLNCSTACLKAPLSMMIAVGFGDAVITKNGKQIYNGEADYQKKGKARRLRYFELLARKSPKNDWRFIKHGPMHGETFQRQGKNNWVCILGLYRIKQRICVTGGQPNERRIEEGGKRNINLFRPGTYS